MKTDAVNRFEQLAAINVGGHIEKKNGLSYLSWAWAVDQLLRADSTAVWSYSEPQKYGDTMMVFCTVTAFGITRTAQLPVMDHRNRAIANPDAFAVNTAMQRCLVKAIALHGLGLYIYAGEDLPPGEKEAKDQEMKAEVQATFAMLREAAMSGRAAMTKVFRSLTDEMRAEVSKDEHKDEWQMIKSAAAEADAQPA